MLLTSEQIRKKLETEEGRVRVVREFEFKIGRKLKNTPQLEKELEKIKSDNSKELFRLNFNGFLLEKQISDSTEFHVPGNH